MVANPLKKSLLGMKSLKESLFDTDLVSKDIIMYHPRTKFELRNCIEEQLEIQGPNANLNIIDVSKITDMSNLFKNLNIRNIDISVWDVSSVNDMRLMFYNCKTFNSDLSKWDVSSVKDMRGMFAECKNFNSDLSKWDVSNVIDMIWMFDGCKSLKKIPSWYEKS